MSAPAGNDPLHFNYRSSAPARTLFFLLDRRWWFYGWAWLIFLVKHLPAWAMPFLVARLIDTLAKPERFKPTHLATFAIVYVIVLVMNIPLQTYLTTMLSGATRRMEARLRDALVTRLHHLSFSFLDKTKTGKLQTKILRDVEQVQFMCTHIGQVGPMLVSSLLMAIVYTAFTEPRMLLFFVVMAPVSVGLLLICRKPMATRNERFRHEVESMNAEVVETIAMIPVTRAHGVEDAARRGLGERFADVQRKGHDLDRFTAVFGASSWVVFQASTASALLAAFWLAWKGYITPGEVVIYQSLFNMIVGSIEGIVATFPIYTKGIDSVRSIGEVMECPDIERNEGRRIVENIRGDVTFEHVEFRYDGDATAPAIADFSLRVAPGETVALVGHSGSGKSTLMSLLIGFRRPTKGRILLDGIDMEEIDMRSWRRFIGVVPQQPLLMSGTLRDNIAYGLPGLSEDRLNEAVDMANLREFVDGLPSGLDTRIGEHGATLSGGQRQRVAIARAFARDPRLIILDEATSALDVVSEKLVQEAVNRLAKGRTTFVIAHRLSTIRHAHRIVVLREGRIVEMGTREELVDRKGEFHEMLALQG